MIRRRIIFVLVVWMSLSSFGGCAAFRWGDTEPPASWPLSKGPGKQSISLLLTGASPYIEGLEESAAKAYKESGLFSDVKTHASETDLRAEVDVIVGRSANSDVLIAQLTLFLFPLIQRNEVVIRTTLKNKEGQELGVVEKKDGYTELDGLLMIFSCHLSGLIRLNLICFTISIAQPLAKPMTKVCSSFDTRTYRRGRR